MGPRRLAAVILLPTSLLLVVMSASAEWLANFDLGGAFTSDADVTIHDPVGSLMGMGRFSTSFTLGGRLGHYFEDLPWLGFAFDVSYFSPNAQLTLGPLTLDRIDLTVVPLSFLAMFRHPILPSELVPRGQLEPFFAVGPSLMISDIAVPLSPGQLSIHDTVLNLGLDARAGLGWRFDQHVGLFAEYRFTFVRPEFEEVLAGTREVVRTTLQTHHLLVGVSFRF